MGNRALSYYPHYTIYMGNKGDFYNRRICSYPLNYPKTDRLTDKLFCLLPRAARRPNLLFLKACPLPIGSSSSQNRQKEGRKGIVRTIRSNGPLADCPDAFKPLLTIETLLSLGLSRNSIVRLGEAI